MITRQMPTKASTVMVIVNLTFYLSLHSYCESVETHFPLVHGMQEVTKLLN